MRFNISKCVTLRCYRMLSPSLFTYVLNDQPISCVDQHPYLGVILTSNMSFSPHIQKITVKATRVLNFIKRNLYNCSKEIKSKAYLTLVRPILEYASPVWDPHLIKDSDQIEKVHSKSSCSLGNIGLQLVKQCNSNAKQFKLAYYLTPS